LFPGHDMAAVERQKPACKRSGIGMDVGLPHGPRSLSTHSPRAKPGT
jgi:hypothetical protein